MSKLAVFDRNKKIWRYILSKHLKEVAYIPKTKPKPRYHTIVVRAGRVEQIYYEEIK